MKNPRTKNWASYAMTFLITALVFSTALYVSNYYNSRSTVDIKAMQDSIAIDILSAQTQFELLSELPCSDIKENSVLSTEIQPLAQRVTYLESQPSIDQKRLNQLKQQYSLLQVKDLLLMQKIADKCKLKPVFVLYFYSNKGDCKDCEQQGYALTTLAQKYPQLRVYSFDYNLGLSALQTLIKIKNVRNELPALVINEKVYYGLHSADSLESLLPNLPLPTATSSKYKI